MPICRFREDSGTPKSSISMGFSVTSMLGILHLQTIHFGDPLVMETPIYIGWFIGIPRSWIITIPNVLGGIIPFQEFPSILIGFPL